MSERPDRPRRGPIRRAYTVIYGLFCIALMSSIALQVTWYVFYDADAAEDRVGADITLDSEDGRRCTQDLRGLYDRLKTRGDRALMQEKSPAEADAQWHQFATDWQRELTTLGARCRLRSTTMKPLRVLAKDLERLEAAYSTALKGYTRIGQKPHTRLQSGFAALN